MPRKSTKRTGNSAAWKAVSRLLRNLDDKEWLGLLQELYHASSDNVEIIETYFQRTGKPLLDKYRSLILYEFDDRHIQRDYSEHPVMSYCKKLIRDYRKGTDDLAGTVELMLTFQECGAKFTMDYGDIDSRFYDSLTSGIDDLAKILMGEGKYLFPVCQERLLKLLQLIYQQCGYGYSDWMQETIEEVFGTFGLGIQCVNERKTSKWRTEYTLEVIEKEYR